MLKRVSIHNFKSLKDVTLDLQKVNLLIGPNNSGKTNFLKALELMASISKDLKRSTFDLPIEMHFGKGENHLFENISINLLFDAIGGAPFDYFELLDADGNYFIEYSNQAEANSQRNKTKDQAQYWLFLHLNNLLIYKPDPNKLTQPGLVGTGEEIVSADCSNLVGFLDLMLGKYRKPVFNRTETDLNTCIPEFDEINLEDAPPTEELKKQFGDKSFKRIGLTNSKQGITYWADELSEGTLYFLALLCIINQPNPPKLLLLEEPEKGIHPRRIWEIMKFIFQLAEEKDVQIILTTHNEHVVNAFSSMPESVFVFDKDEETGATSVRNLQDIIEKSHEKSAKLSLDKIDFTENLGDNWLYGLIGGVPANNL